MPNTTMGLGNSKYINELSSDDSDSDTESTESAKDEEPITTNSLVLEPKETGDVANIQLENRGSLEACMYLTVDAVKPSVSFPNAENVLNLDVILKLEQYELDMEEIISLVFLLYEDETRQYYALQELTLRLHDKAKIVLHAWAHSEQRKGNLWKKKFIEALCVIKNYKFLKTLGYKKEDLIAHYLPHQANSALYINKTYKGLYLMCEYLTEKKTETFIEKVREDFTKRGIEFVECHPEYLEMYLISWETCKYISKTNVSNIKKIFKVMEEDLLCDMFDELMKEVPAESRSLETNSMLFDNFPLFPQAQAIRNEEFDWRNHNLNIPKTRKTSTSVDNNRSPGANLNILYEQPVGTGSYGGDNTNPVKENIGLNRYPIDSKNPGIVLIINQENFFKEIAPEYKHLLSPSKLETRIGTEKDREALENIFTKLGFQVIVENNLNHKAIIERIKEVANEITIESSFFVCILSHGDEGHVYGSNSCKIKVTKIQSLICKTNKSHLLGKPKVLILQSCQGWECQKINEDSSSEDEDEENHAITTDSPNGQSVPRTADMLTFWATVPGYAAIRNKKRGSWFIQALCDKIELLGNELHLTDICTSVVNEVTGKTWKQQEDIIAMTPEVVQTFRYHFYLPPLKK